MSLKKLIAYLIVLGALLIILLFVIFRGPTKNDILLEISRANYCGSKDDCATVENAEAIKCNAFVNIGELEKIQSLVDEFGNEKNETCGEEVAPSCLQFQCK